MSATCASTSPPHERAPWSLDALRAQHGPAVTRYAQRRVPPVEVEAVVVETFARARRRIVEVPAFPLPWLLAMARGVSADHHRSARRRRLGR
ncbi:MULTISPECIES: sigma factor [unclassified Blastococcus]